MKYFIPAADTPGKRDELRAAIIARLGGNFGAERIYRVRYASGGEEYDVKVGEPHPVTRDPVLLIAYENDRAVYYICTQRSVTSGIPILAPLHSVREVEYFEPEPDTDPSG